MAFRKVLTRPYLSPAKAVALARSMGARRPPRKIVPRKKKGPPK